jgi:hypothetical protein
MKKILLATAALIGLSGSAMALEPVHMCDYVKGFPDKVCMGIPAMKMEAQRNAYFKKHAGEEWDRWQKEQKESEKTTTYHPEGLYVGQQPQGPFLTAEQAPKPAEQTREVKCIPFSEGETVTISGYVAKTRQVDEEEGEPPHDFYQIILDKPLCDKTYKDTLVYSQEIDVKPELLGYSIEIEGTMTQGLDWYIEPKSIRVLNEDKPSCFKTGSCFNR